MESSSSQVAKSDGEVITSPCSEYSNRSNTNASQQNLINIYNSNSVSSIESISSTSSNKNDNMEMSQHTASTVSTLLQTPSSTKSLEFMDKRESSQLESVGIHCDDNTKLEALSNSPGFSKVSLTEKSSKSTDADEKIRKRRGQWLKSERMSHRVKYLSDVACRVIICPFNQKVVPSRKANEHESESHVMNADVKDRYRKKNVLSMKNSGAKFSNSFTHLRDSDIDYSSASGDEKIVSVVAKSASSLSHCTKQNTKPSNVSKLKPKSKMTVSSDSLAQDITSSESTELSMPVIDDKSVGSNSPKDQNFTITGLQQSVQTKVNECENENNSSLREQPASSANVPVSGDKDIQSTKKFNNDVGSVAEKKRRKHKKKLRHKHRHKREMPKKREDKKLPTDLGEDIFASTLSRVDKRFKKRKKLKQREDKGSPIVVSTSYKPGKFMV